MQRELVRIRVQGNPVSKMPSSNGIADLLKAMRARMPWDGVAQPILKSLSIPRGRGWDKTLAKLQNYKPPVGLQTALEQALKEHIWCGEKLCSFYNLSVKDIADLRKKVLGLTPGKSPFKNYYPLPIPEAEADQTSIGAPVLIAIDSSDDGVALVFGSIRVIELRVPLNLDDLPSGAAEALAGYERVLGVKLERLQANDLIWIPNQGTTVEVRVDFPKGSPKEAGRGAQALLKQAYKKLLDHELVGEVNVFPLIEKMYKADDEGQVVELAFGVHTGSLKHERMRRKHTCLRREMYHKGGKAAVKGAIEPFRLSLEWQVDLPSGATTSPELTFNGNSLIGASAKPTLSDVVVRRCAGAFDFAFVRSRVQHYL